jgi:hypothetical protein
MLLHRRRLCKLAYSTCVAHIDSTREVQTGSGDAMHTLSDCHYQKVSTTVAYCYKPVNGQVF